MSQLEQSGVPLVLGTMRASWARLTVSALAAAIAAVLLVRFLPADYVSEASILFDGAVEGVGGFDLSQFSDALQSGLGGGTSRRENAHSYVPIVQSRNVLDRVLTAPDPEDSSTTIGEYFAPRHGPSARRRELAIKSLRGSVSVNLDAKPGVLTIGVKDQSPVRAAAIANLLIQEVQRFNRENRLSRASDAADFIEARLNEARASLAIAEDNLATFRSRNARIGNSPSLILQERRFVRAVELEEQTFLLLARQLELARIQEKREAPVFSVIDVAIPPTKPTRFPYSIAAIVAALFAVVGHLLLITGRSALAWTPDTQR